MADLNEPTLFDLEPIPTTPVADRFAGMGHDARRTARQLEVLAEGRNPGTRVPLHLDAATGRDGTGLRCKNCVHLYKAAAHDKTFLKCKQAGVYNSRGSIGPDMRAWWPACCLFEPKAKTKRD